MARLLDDEEITRQLGDLPDWNRDGDTIRAEFVATDFPAAIRLVDEVALLAEAMNHHPDIDIRWTTVRFALSTHSEGGLTQLDIELAHQISQEAARHGGTRSQACRGRREPGAASRSDDRSDHLDLGGSGEVAGHLVGPL